MKDKLDLIIGALEKYIAFTPSFYDLGKEALDAARELRDMKPVAYLQIGLNENTGLVAAARVNPPKEYNPDWWKFTPLYALGDTNPLDTIAGLATYQPMPEVKP